MQMSTALETENGDMIVKRVSVPIGLEELMEGLTKEVLLKKPRDIYLFASEYFSRLLVLRENGNYKANQLRRVQSVTKKIPKSTVNENILTKRVKPSPKPVTEPLKVNAVSKKLTTPRRMKENDDKKENEKSRYRSRKLPSNDRANEVKTTPRKNTNESDKPKSKSERDRSVSSTRKSRSDDLTRSRATRKPLSQNNRSPPKRESPRKDETKKSRAKIVKGVLIPAAAGTVLTGASVVAGKKVASAEGEKVIKELSNSTESENNEIVLIAESNSLETDNGKDELDKALEMEKEAAEITENQKETSSKETTINKTTENEVEEIPTDESDTVVIENPDFTDSDVVSSSLDNKKEVDELAETIETAHDEIQETENVGNNIVENVDESIILPEEEKRVIIIEKEDDLTNNLVENMNEALEVTELEKDDQTKPDDENTSSLIENVVETIKETDLPPEVEYIAANDNQDKIISEIKTEIDEVAAGRNELQELQSSKVSQLDDNLNPISSEDNLKEEMENLEKLIENKENEVIVDLEKNDEQLKNEEQKEDQSAHNQEDPEHQDQKSNSNEITDNTAKSETDLNVENILEIGEEQQLELDNSKVEKENENNQEDQPKSSEFEVKVEHKEVDKSENDKEEKEVIVHKTDDGEEEPEENNEEKELESKVEAEQSNNTHTSDNLKDESEVEEDQLESIRFEEGKSGPDESNIEVTDEQLEKIKFEENQGEPDTLKIEISNENQVEDHLSNHDESKIEENVKIEGNETELNELKTETVEANQIEGHQPEPDELKIEESEENRKIEENEAEPDELKIEIREENRVEEHQPDPDESKIKECGENVKAEPDELKIEKAEEHHVEEPQPVLDESKIEQNEENVKAEKNKGETAELKIEIGEENQVEENQPGPDESKVEEHEENVEVRKNKAELDELKTETVEENQVECQPGSDETKIEGNEENEKIDKNEVEPDVLKTETVEENKMQEREPSLDDSKLGGSEENVKIEENKVETDELNIKIGEEKVEEKQTGPDESKIEEREENVKAEQNKTQPDELKIEKVEENLVEEHQLVPDDSKIERNEENVKAKENKGDADELKIEKVEENHVEERQLGSDESKIEGNEENVKSEENQAELDKLRMEISEENLKENQVESEENIKSIVRPLSDLEEQIETVTDNGSLQKNNTEILNDNIDEEQKKTVVSNADADLMKEVGKEEDLPIESITTDNGIASAVEEVEGIVTKKIVTNDNALEGNENNVDEQNTNSTTVDIKDTLDSNNALGIEQDNEDKVKIPDVVTEEIIRSNERNTNVEENKSNLNNIEDNKGNTEANGDGDKSIINTQNEEENADEIKNVELKTEEELPQQEIKNESGSVKPEEGKMHSDTITKKNMSTERDNLKSSQSEKIDMNEENNDENVTSKINDGEIETTDIKENELSFTEATSEDNNESENILQPTDVSSSNEDAKESIKETIEENNKTESDSKLGEISNAGESKEENKEDSNEQDTNNLDKSIRNMDEERDNVEHNKDDVPPCYDAVANNAEHAIHEENQSKEFISKENNDNEKTTSLENDGIRIGKEVANSDKETEDNKLREKRDVSSITKSDTENLKDETKPTEEEVKLSSVEEKSPPEPTQQKVLDDEQKKSKRHFLGEATRNALSSNPTSLVKNISTKLRETSPPKRKKNIDSGKSDQKPKMIKSFSQENQKLKDDKKLRRVNSVDGLSKKNVSRIPTADSRKRVLQRVDSAKPNMLANVPANLTSDTKEDKGNEDQNDQNLKDQCEFETNDSNLNNENNLEQTAIDSENLDCTENCNNVTDKSEAESINQDAAENIVEETSRKENVDDCQEGKNHTENAIKVEEYKIGEDSSTTGNIKEITSNNENSAEIKQEMDNENDNTTKSNEISVAEQEGESCTDNFNEGNINDISKTTEHEEESNLNSNHTEKDQVLEDNFSNITKNDDENNLKSKRNKRSTSMFEADSEDKGEIIRQSSFDISKLRDELKMAEEVSKLTSFKNSYNPYQLREEIKRASLQSENHENKKPVHSIADIVTESQAATKIQALWKGFATRKSLSLSVEEKEKNDNSSIPEFHKMAKAAPEFNKMAKAAVLIQKLWRGFKVRKIKKEGNLFGSVVDTEDKQPEEIRSTEPNERHALSALKIQSLWRGYQVRKNINNVKSKLDELQTTDVNDSTKNNSKIKLNDIDIFRAASKIQAGIRGYLQRKKNSNKLDGIEESEETTDETKLNEDDVNKALEQLDKIKIPEDSPSVSGGHSDVPQLNRTMTVQEPEIIKEIAQILHTSSTDGKLKDDNNNNESDKSDITPLEREVKEAIINISKSLTDDNGTKNSEFDVNNLKTEINNVVEDKSQALLNAPISNNSTDPNLTEHSAINLVPIQENINNLNESIINTTTNTSDAIKPIVNNTELVTENNSTTLNFNHSTHEECKSDPDTINDVYENAPTRPVTSEVVQNIPTYANNQTITNTEIEHTEMNRNETIKDISKSSLMETGDSIVNMLNKINKQISNASDEGNEKTDKLEISTFDIDQLRKDIEETNKILSEDLSVVGKSENGGEIILNEEPTERIQEGIQNDDHEMDADSLEPVTDLTNKFDLSKLKNEINVASERVENEKTMEENNSKIDEVVQSNDNVVEPESSSKNNKFDHTNEDGEPKSQSNKEVTKDEATNESQMNEEFIENNYSNKLNLEDLRKEIEEAAQSQSNHINEDEVVAENKPKKLSDSEEYYNKLDLEKLREEIEDAHHAQSATTIETHAIHPVDDLKNLVDNEQKIKEETQQIPSKDVKEDEFNSSVNNCNKLDLGGSEATPNVKEEIPNASNANLSDQNHFVDSNIISDNVQDNENNSDSENIANTSNISNKLKRESEEPEISKDLNSLSTDSTDSCITVIPNTDLELQQPDKELNSIVEESSKSKVSTQNSVDDKDSVNIPTTSFDIDQLRKELEEVNRDPKEFSQKNSGSILNENEAATKIQSAFRGYLVRRDITSEIKVPSRKLSDIKEEQSDIKSLNEFEFSNAENLKNCEDVNPLDRNFDPNTEFSNDPDIFNDSTDIKFDSTQSNNLENSIEVKKLEDNKSEPTEVSDKNKDGMESPKPIELGPSQNLENENINKFSEEYQNNLDISEKPNLTNKEDLNVQEPENQMVSFTRTTSPQQQPVRLLHDGELRDSIVIPLPLVQSSSYSHQMDIQIDPANVNGNAESPVNSNSRNMQDNALALAVQLNQEAPGFIFPNLTNKEDLNVQEPENQMVSFTRTTSPQQQPVRLLHDGELRDSIVIPLPLVQSSSYSHQMDIQIDPANVNGNAESPVNSNSRNMQDNALALAVQLNQEAPAGTEVVVTSPNTLSTTSVCDVAPVAQASDKDALPFECGSEIGMPPDSSMETEKRNNATTTTSNGNKNMEAEAATKIQAGFRGYQVRKQMKQKTTTSEISNQRRSARRKSAGKLTEPSIKTKPKDSAEIEEQSAVKIQAGIRGFLVRRRQKKQKHNES